MAEKKVVLLKSGNRIVVDPTTPRIKDALAPVLTFLEKKFMHGWAARLARQNGEPPFETIHWECFGEDHKRRLATSFGFWRKIKRTLQKKGYKVVMRDLQPCKKPEVFEPQWDRLKRFGIELKEDQWEFLIRFFSNPCGRFECPPGYGKSFLIGVIALLCPKAKIDVVTKRVAVARERIYPELCQMLPSVGMVGGGTCRKGHRVMVYTIGSLHHSKGDADILIADECHELVSDTYVQKFGKYDESRNYGLSASQDKRLDNKDMRGEGVFGPIIYRVTYEKAESLGMVVPIEVNWNSVVMDVNPCSEASDSVDRKRLGIWTNDYRNDLIAKVARRYGDDVQVLITCETIEHVVNLKARLPEFQIVHREDGMSLKDRKWYIKNGLLQPDEPHMTVERRARLTRRFERGKLKKVICNTVWNVGVSFNELDVLIRADGGGSPVNDTQIPGRVSRNSADGMKSVGIVEDFLDQFDNGCHRKALGRQNSYAEHKWKQNLPKKKKKKKGSPNQLMLWDEEE